MPEVTLVLLGCEVRPDPCFVSKVFLTLSQGVMANGCVLATVGTSQTALMAKSANKPVVVCCETYKFTPRVQTDSFVYNELSDPDDLVKLGPGQASLVEGWRDQASLSLLNPCLCSSLFGPGSSQFVPGFLLLASTVPALVGRAPARRAKAKGRLCQRGRGLGFAKSGKLS